jgi:hypothetical protein
MDSRIDPSIAEELVYVRDKYKQSELAELIQKEVFL